MAAPFFRRPAIWPESWSFLHYFITLFIYAHLAVYCLAAGDPADKAALRNKALEMFMHGYQSYMKYAYPHDELMPLTCQGRVRGVTASRGDVDDSLGNFTLTLVDTLDTLVVIGELEEFEKAVKLVIENVRFDSNIVVSVFETNIRMVGGLISGHIMAKLVQSRQPSRMVWYKTQLLSMAENLADRLLPAFNTTSGIPYARINLRYGMLDYLKQQTDTCTACSGTMLLEFAALSRLTGRPIYEEKARKAMDYLWEQRHRGTDLMGTVLNVHSGDWIRRDAGIGAGIDSYYEYCLKTYILLGDTDYLYRFNKHYEAIMRYVNKGPLFIDVHMHKPTVAARSFMDSLLAFWPGLQVLKGDLKSAIEFHEILYQVIKKHRFLPEAFTHDLQIHWAQYPLRPEFIESTYLLYKATKDPHYLNVARRVMESLDEHVRVKCGFAGIKDVRTMTHEDRMDSFVLSETFKYLYLIFSEPSDLILDPDNYVLTTEAHFLPLSIGDTGNEHRLPRRVIIDPDEMMDELENEGAKKYRSACPNIPQRYSSEQLPEYGRILRSKVQTVVNEITKNFASASDSSSQTCAKPDERLRAWAFSASNSDHLRQLKQMGIQMHVQSDGRVQMVHLASLAASPQWAGIGVEFMQDMIQTAAQLENQELEMAKANRIVQILSQPIFGTVVFKASPAQFGSSVDYTAIDAEAQVAVPFKGCRPFSNSPAVSGKIAIVERQECMFQEKARFAQRAGAVGIIIVDDTVGTSSETSATFAMSGDNSIQDDITIPVVFLYHQEGHAILNHITRFPHTLIRISDRPANPSFLFASFIKNGKFSLSSQLHPVPPVDTFLIDWDRNSIVVVDSTEPAIMIVLGFKQNPVTSSSTVIAEMVEENVMRLRSLMTLPTSVQQHEFFNIIRHLAYACVGKASYPYPEQLERFSSLISDILMENRENIMVPSLRYSQTLICRTTSGFLTCYKI